LAFYYVVYPHIRNRGGKEKVFLKRHEEIKRFIKREFSDIFERYRRIKYTNCGVQESILPIWICWLQGETEMPNVVKLCYRSVCANASVRPVRLITLENVDKYIRIPDLVRYNLCKRVSYTHYADYIRILLLREYGGLWIDASILVTGNITIDTGFAFYSIKQRNDNIRYVSQYRWLVGLMGCSLECGKYMFACLDDIFTAYLKKYPLFIDYFLLDYFIAAMYDELPDVKMLIDELPYNSCTFYDLIALVDEKYNDKEWAKIKSGSIFHRLTWKKSFRTRTVNGEDSFYGTIARCYK